MSDEHLEDTLRARLHGAIDPRVPGPAAEQRVLSAVRGAGHATTSRFGFRVGPRIGAAIAAAMVVLVVGGALGVSLVLRNGTTSGRPAPAASGPAGASSTASPSTVPLESPHPSPMPSQVAPVAGIQPCAAAVLTARLYDQDGAAGTVGGDIALRNDGTVACTLKGYVNLHGVVGGHVVQLGVTHLSTGLLNNYNGRLPTVRLVTVQPGHAAYIAFENSDVINGPTPCAAAQTLLITPPQGGGRYVSLTGTPISLCGSFRQSLWINIAPVSSTPYFNTRIP